MIMHESGAAHDEADSGLKVQRRTLLDLLAKRSRPRGFDRRVVSDFFDAYRETPVSESVLREVGTALRGSSFLDLTSPPELVFAAIPQLAVPPNGDERCVRARGLAILADAIANVTEPTIPMIGVARQCAEAALTLTPQDPGVQYVAMVTRYRAGETRCALGLAHNLCCRSPTHTMVVGHAALLEFRLAARAEARVATLTKYLLGLERILAQRQPSPKQVLDYLSLLWTGEASPRLGGVMTGLRAKYPQLESILGPQKLNQLCQLANHTVPAESRRPLGGGLAYKLSERAWPTVPGRA